MSTFLIAEMAMLCFARYLCIQPLLAYSNVFKHLFHFGTCFFSKELQLPSLVHLHSLINSLICPFAFEAMELNVLQLLRLDGVFLFYILLVMMYSHAIRPSLIGSELFLGIFSES